MSSCNSVAPLGGVAFRSLATTVEEGGTFPLSHTTAGLAGFDDRVSHVDVFGCVSGTGHDFTHQADNASHSHISGANFAVGDNPLPVYPVYPGTVEEQGSYSGSADAFPFPIPQTPFDGGGSVSRQGEFGSECSIPTSCRLHPSSVGYDHTRDALDAVFGSSSCLPPAEPPLLCDTQGLHVSVGASVPPGMVEQGSSSGSAGAFPLSMSQISFDGAGSVFPQGEFGSECAIPPSYCAHHLPIKCYDHTRNPLEAVSGASLCLHAPFSAEPPPVHDAQGSNCAVGGAFIGPGTVEGGYFPGSADALAFPMPQTALGGPRSVSRQGESGAVSSTSISAQVASGLLCLLTNDDNTRDAFEAASGASSRLHASSLAEQPPLFGAQGSHFSVGAPVPSGTAVEGRSPAGSADVSPFPMPQTALGGPRSVSRQGESGSVSSTSISAQETPVLHRLLTSDDNTRDAFEAVSGASSCLHASSFAEQPPLFDAQGSHFAVGAPVPPGTAVEGRSSAGSADVSPFPMPQTALGGPRSVSRQGESGSVSSTSISAQETPVLHRLLTSDDNTRDAFEAVSGASSCLHASSFAEQPPLFDAQGSHFAVGAPVPPGTAVEGRSSAGSADLSPFPMPQTALGGPRSVSRQGESGSVSSTSISAQETSSLLRLLTNDDNTRGDCFPCPSEASTDILPLHLNYQSLVKSSASSVSSSEARVSLSGKKPSKRIEIIKKVANNRITVQEGARQLQVLPRQVHKILESYYRCGEDGIISRRGWNKKKRRVRPVSSEQVSQAGNNALASGTERIWPVFPTKTDPLVKQEAFAIALAIGFTPSFLSTTFHIGKVEQRALYKLAYDQDYVSKLQMFNYIKQQSKAGVDRNTSNKSSKESAQALFAYVDYLERVGSQEVSPPVLAKLKEIAGRAVSCFNEDNSGVPGSSSRAVEDHFLPVCPGMMEQGISSDHAGLPAFSMPLSYDEMNSE